MDKLQHLRIINYFNLNLPIYEDEVKNTDLIISKMMGKFLTEYASQIRQRYTFILDYRNDIFSLIAYSIIKNCASVSKIDLDIRYLGKLKTEEEKKYFKGAKEIGIKKATKLKKAILITSFNPICNVIELSFFSKHFIEIFNPIENFTPTNLKMIQEYYFSSKDFKKFYIQNLGQRTDEEHYWNEYFSYPITEIKNCYNFDLENFYKEKINEEVNIVLFSLMGTEKDFELYDFILKSSKEGNIHLYMINGNEDNLTFAKTNLNAYIDSKNMIQDLNLLNNESYFQFLEKYSGKYYYYNIENFKGDSQN